MNRKFIIIILLFSITVQAKFLEGSIVFKDGHTESGFIKSFLENDFFDFGLAIKPEKKFNLDDRTLKFKSSKDGEVVTYDMKEIGEVHINGTNGMYEVYVAVAVKTINKKGEIVDYNSGVWLPLIKKGKIILYGFQYEEYTFGMPPEYNAKFYFQKPGDRFVLSPYENTTLFNKKANKLIYYAFMKYLFESCPEFYESHAEIFRKEAENDFPKEEKIARMKAESKRSIDYFNYSYERTLKNAFNLHFYQLFDPIQDFEDACN